MAFTHAARPDAGAAPAGTMLETAGWRLVALIWAVYAVAMGVPDLSGVMDRMSTDDLMRLVEVRDLLAGQSWFDLVQHRLNPPDGVLMHWSRVVDLPIAIILAGLGSVLATDLATALTVTLWPLLLLLPAMLATASACRTLGGPSAAAIGIAVILMSPGVTTRFMPGAIDHHGAQIALALTLLACALKADRSVRAAAGAGVAAALMMAIGMETAPHVAACAALVALRWAFSNEDGMARGAAAFGLAFAGGTALVAGLTLPPSSLLAPTCDALGLGHLVVAAIAGLGLAAAAHIATGGWIVRLGALGALAVATGAGLVASAPNCLASPYAGLPDRLVTGWLNQVQEAQNIVASAIAEPAAGFAVGLPLVALIVVSVWAVVTAPREKFWPVATVAALCAVSVAVTAWQVRGAALAFAFGGVLLPLAAQAIGRTGDRVRTILAVLALSPASLGLVGLGVASAVGLPSMNERGFNQGMCLPDDYKRLESRAEPGLSLNTIDTGPSLLAYTRGSVVAAPYHRNIDGLTASLDAFSGSEEEARAIALSRGAKYLVGCASDGGLGPIARRRPESFAATLLKGDAPAWLEPVDLGPETGLRVWRVKPGG